MTRLLSLASLASLALLSGCTAPSDGGDAADSTEALIGAPLDTKHTFDVGICAGGLVPDGQPNAGTCLTAKCSGTLVAPNLVLTAHHCINKLAAGPTFCATTFATDPLASAAPLVTTSPSVIAGTPKWYGIDKVLVPPGNNLCADDLALLVLANDVPLREAVPVPMAIFRDVAASPPKSVAIVGRGNISDVLDFTTGKHTTDNGGLQRRVLEHVPFICAADGATTCTAVDFTSPPTNTFDAPASYFLIGSALAGGDSGSGVFDQATFHFLPFVIGVSASVTYGADGVPAVGLVSRLDKHEAFLVDGIWQAALARATRLRALRGEAAVAHDD